MDESGGGGRRNNHDYSNSSNIGNNNGALLFHPRSHSLCSNLLLFSSQSSAIPSYSAAVMNPQQQQSLAALYSPMAPHQQTLVGIETLMMHGGEFEPPQMGQGRRLTNDGGPNFGRRVSRVDNTQLRPHLSSSWLEKVFQRRDCIKFIPADDHSDRCGCGQSSALHSQLALSRFTSAVVTRGGPFQQASTGRVVSASSGWSIGTCTAGSPTDAYGTIEFQGGTHVHKARYLRLSFDSDPADVMTLMERVWGLERPRLVISVHGGTGNFNVPENLGRVFREGLLKAAETTGAWVLTSGLDSGVVKHVARALDEAGISARMRSRIVTVGIAPWGLLERREQLIGRDAQVCYDRPSPSAASARGGADGAGGGLVLNDRHSYFLLADNGTVDRYGADIVLRRRLEQFLARKSATSAGAENDSLSDCHRRRIPIICVVLEGGLCTLNSIDQYLHGQPPVPVVVCEGSGRVSDLLAQAESNLDANGHLTAKVRAKLLARVGLLLMSCHSDMHLVAHQPYNIISAEALLDRIVKCAGHRKQLLTVFHVRPRENCQMDRVILRALLHGQGLSPVDQLLLTLAWGREDIARSEVFQSSCCPPPDPDWLIQPMMEALLMGEVEFVRLFLEQGLSPKRFLTFGRLEQLYNACRPTLGPLMAGKQRAANWKSQSSSHRRPFTLPEIGAAIERLMGNGFRSAYTSRAFKCRYEQAKCSGGGGGGGGAGGVVQLRRSATRQFSSLHMCLGGSTDQEEEFLTQQQPQRKCALACPSPPSIAVGSPQQQERASSTTPGSQQQQQQPPDFAFPFNELMIWAVLTRRHEMAKLFWQYGEEPMAKALAAIRLYKCMSREAAHDYTELEVSNQLRECAQEFRDCSLELLNHCHQQDQRMTIRLLTAQLPNWGNHACLSLAVIANNKRFLAHPCCQILLADLWHGGLRFRSQSNVNVVLGLLFPPSILLLDFKTPNGATMAADEKTTAAAACNKDQQQQQQWRMMRKEAGGGGDEADGLLPPMMNNEKDGQFGGMESKSPSPQHRPRLLASANSLVSKFVLFYSAPITSFWVWSISFLLFMLALIYVLLVEFPAEIPPLEWLLFAYVLALAMEHFRKLLVLEASSLVEKLRIFYNNYWNILTTVAALSYFLGFALRFDSARMHSHSRVILAANSVLWHMKLFDFLSVHPRIGPYITMAGKMVLAMSYIIVLLMVTLMAFGVARQSITFPHEKWAWILVRNIFYKPYFMLYGEVYAGEIDTCGDEGTNCVPGHWIPPILMTVFLLIANILLINMLIAIFNNIFNAANVPASLDVPALRAGDGVQVDAAVAASANTVGPSADVGSPMLQVCCPFHQQQQQQEVAANTESDFALKVQLGPKELRELQDFEEDCMDDLSRRKCRQTTLATSHNSGQQQEQQQWQCQFSSRMGDREDPLEMLAQQMQKLQRKVEQLGQNQQRLVDLLLLSNCSAGGEEAEIPAINITRRSEPADKSDKQFDSRQRKKLIPRAHVQPISCCSSAPTAGSSNSAVAATTGEQNGSQFGGLGEEEPPRLLRSSPHISVLPTSAAAGDQSSSAASSAPTTTAQFTLFEEEEEGGGGPRAAEPPPMTIDSTRLHANWPMMAEQEEEHRQRHRNHSVTLGEELEQMFGMLRRWTAAPGNQ